MGAFQRHVQSLLCCATLVALPAVADPGAQKSLLRIATPPVNTNISAAGTLPKGVFFSALNASFASKTHAEHGSTGSDVDSSLWLLKLRYGLTDNLELAAITPYIDLSRSHPTPDPKHLRGIGDQIIGLSLSPFNIRQKDPFSLHVTAALALPTGEEGKSHPPGNGVWGWRLSTTYGFFPMPNTRLDTELVWSGPFERGNQEVKRGQNVQWNTQLRQLFGVFDLGLESSLVRQESGDVKTPVGMRNLRNGYKEWFVGPSANVSMESLDAWMGVGVFFPLYQHFDGPNKSEHWRFEFKIGKIW